MCKDAIRLVWHDDYRACGNWKINRRHCFSGSPLTKPERPFFSKRDCDDWSAGHHIRDAVAMGADVMAETSVIPVQQESIERVVNHAPGPCEERCKQRWSGSGLVYVPSVVISHSVC